MLVNEELSDKQKKRVDSYKIGDNPRSVDISRHVIPAGQDRLTIPLADPKDEKIEVPHDIKAHFEKHGIEVHDYLNGKVKDKYGRDMKLGKALQQTNAHPDLINKFNTDPARNNARTHKNLQVVISRHPYDVAGMSTNRGWTSCMDMDAAKRGDTSYTQFLHHDIKNGTHVAYLTHKDDHDIKNPIARIALKPYSSEDNTHHVLRPESKTYGTAASSFEHTVNGWTNEHFPLKKETVYHKRRAVYDDSEGEGRVLSHTPTDAMVDKALKNPIGSENSKSEDVLGHFTKAGTNEHRDKILSTLVGYKEKYPYRYIPNAISMGIAEHGTDQQHERLLNIDPHNTAYQLSTLGSDHARQKIIEHPHIDVFSKSEAISNIKDKSLVKQYVNHPNEIIRQSVATFHPEFHKEMMHDSSTRVTGAIIRTTKDKDILNHFITPEKVHEYSKLSTENNVRGKHEHVVSSALWNTHLGDDVRQQLYKLHGAK